MFIEGTIIGLLLGKIRGGRFLNLERLAIRGWILIILALMIQISPIFSKEFPLISKYQLYTQGISFTLLAIVMLMNIDKGGVWVLLLGISMNMAALFFNGFKMPIDFDALHLSGLETMAEAIKEGKIIQYCFLDEAPGWTKYLGRFIPLPKGYPLSKVLSIGDIFITLGMILVLQGEMIRNKYQLKNKMIKFNYKGKI